MNSILVEEWRRIIVEINWEIDKLPTIILRSHSVSGVMGGVITPNSSHEIDRLDDVIHSAEE